MSEEAQTQEPSKSQNEMFCHTAAIPDWFLQQLVNMVNTGVISMGITLNVGGFLVSGQLIGGRKYFENFAETFSSAIPDENEADAIRELFAQNGELYKADEDGSSDRQAANYIHLINARFFNSKGDAIPSNGTLWRGRLAEVSGFFLGSLGAS